MKHELKDTYQKWHTWNWKKYPDWGNRDQDNPISWSLGGHDVRKIYDHFSESYKYEIHSTYVHTAHNINKTFKKFKHAKLFVELLELKNK